MASEHGVYDVTIIGGGPTGLFAAFYGGMRQLSVKIIESTSQLGGQLAALGSGKTIHAVPGYATINGAAFVDELIEQAYLFDPTVVLKQTLQTVDKNEDGLFVLATDEAIHYSRTILITAGADSSQPRRLDMANAASYETCNLHYYIDDIYRFQGRKVFICGGGNSAVEWALALEPIAGGVSLCHRRNHFRAHEQSVAKLMHSTVNVLTPYNLVAINGDGQQINDVVIQKAQGKGQETYVIDDLVVNYGFVSSLGPNRHWGLDIDKGAIVVDEQMETNIGGIFAAGDIATYKNKVKSLATGFGEVPNAIGHIKSYMNRERRVQSPYSTQLTSKVADV